MTDPRAAREYVRRNVRPCPCCGAGLLVAVDGGPETVAAMEQLARSGARIQIVAAEAGETEIREKEFRPVDPLGGRS